MLIGKSLNIIQICSNNYQMIMEVGLGQGLHCLSIIEFDGVALAIILDRGYYNVFKLSVH